MNDPLDGVRTFRARSEAPDLDVLEQSAYAGSGTVAPARRRPSRPLLLAAAVALLAGLIGVAVAAIGSDPERSPVAGEPAGTSIHADPEAAEGVCALGDPPLAEAGARATPVPEGVDEYGEPQDPSVDVVVELTSGSDTPEPITMALGGTTVLDVMVPAATDCADSDLVHMFGFAVTPEVDEVVVTGVDGRQTASLARQDGALRWVVIEAGGSQIGTHVTVYRERPEWG